MTADDFKTFRKQLRWSQGRAAAELGLSRRMWQQYESGETKPSRNRARTFGLAMAAVLYGLKPWPVKEREER